MMSKIENVLKKINSFIEKAENKKVNIEDIMPKFDGLEKLPNIIEEYEKVVARLLRKQMRFYVKELEGFVSKDDTGELDAFFAYMKYDLFASDQFKGDFRKETADFLESTIKELAKIMMDSIDRDVAFSMLSQTSLEWIEFWSEDLADLMELRTHNALEGELLDVIVNGESIAEAEQRIKDLPEFSRNRARTTARTEILTASSQAHYESFAQSPAVVGKKWRHSGTKNIDAREEHMAMDGVETPVDSYFIVDGEMGLYPRDPSFSARNRVNCGCVISPVIDNSILRLSKEEKEELRREALEELN